RYPPLALSAAQQRRLTLAALIDQLEALSRQKPVLMLFEDVHWADATSLEVLDLTVERIRALPVLALFTFRPEYEAPWTGLSHVTNIALDRFAPAEVEPLAQHVGPAAAARGDGADRRQDRRGAALCRRIDQDSAGIGSPDRGVAGLASRRAIATLRHSGDVAGFIGGTPRSAGAGQGGGTDRRCDRPR